MNLSRGAARIKTDNTMLGIGTMLISVLIFSVMDAVVKWLGGIYPTQQIMFFRCTMAMIPVMVLIYLNGGAHILRTDKPLLHLIRSILGISAMACAFYGFSLMRLADAISILHTTPLFMTVLSVLILREKVGVRRWFAVVIGFVGMLIVVRPGENIFDSGSTYMLIAALAIATTTIIVRYLSASDNPASITFYFTLSGSAVSALACLWWGWQLPPMGDCLLLIAVGLLGGCAQYAMTLSYRHAEVGTVAPLKYLSIVVGGLTGYIVWAEVPDRQSLVGITIIVASGLYTLHRETRLDKRVKEYRAQMTSRQ